MIRLGIFRHQTPAMIRHGWLLFLVTICVLRVNAQKTLQKVFNSKDKNYGYYTVIEPSGKPERLLVLLDGYGGNASSFLAETEIDEEAYRNNILTVCLPTGVRLYADSSICGLITTTLKGIITEYKIPANKVAMGGFSSGGTIVLRYAELCKQNPSAYPVSPAAVFTGDSPVDLAGLYRSAKRELEKGFQGWWLDESRMIIQTLGDTFGQPDKTPTAWNAVNPFNAADTSKGNEQYLATIACRTYHDVDVEWQLKNRGRSLYQFNALDASELVSRLQLRGNNKAAFIQSKIPGMRANGQRHPHSWNIIEAKELVEWIKAEL